MPIWSTDYLNNLTIEAEEQLAMECKCVIDRVALDIKRGKSAYTLPDYVLGITRVTWLGYKVWPVNQYIEWQDFYPVAEQSTTTGAFESTAHDNASFYVSAYNDTPQGKPYWYVFSGLERNTMQLFPAPPQDVLTTTSNLWGSEIVNRCIVEFYRLPDPTVEVNRIPAYFRRYAIKAYVLTHAFMKEGSGQNLKAAQYYKQKYDLIIEVIKLINSGCFVSKNTNSTYLHAYKPGRPVLPVSRFGVDVEWLS